MKKYILPVLIGAFLFGAGYFLKNDGSDEIRNLKELRERLIENIINLEKDLSNRDLIIGSLKDTISKEKEIIDSLNSLEHEIKSPIYSDIPVDERNRAIERLALEK